MCKILFYLLIISTPFVCVLIITLLKVCFNDMIICFRYLQPPAEWVVAALESRELLALCLKKLKGLNRVKLIDAGFAWTEPHSKRIKVLLMFRFNIIL